MLKANSRQFFNYKMKGRRARIRNQKRSRHYRSRFDRFLDNHAKIVEEDKLKRKDSSLYLPKTKQKPIQRELVKEVVTPIFIYTFIIISVLLLIFG